MRKRLGQHFLKNRNLLAKIAKAVAPKNCDTIIEIGAGHGELTKELGIKNKELRIIAIEKDTKLARLLKEKFGAQKNIEIIGGDVLSTLPSIIRNSKPPIRNYKLVGNIPFYITGRLFRILGELEPKPQLIVLTIQKEVAERICAKPPKMNLLAAAVQLWAEPQIIGYVPKKYFSPPPKVDSGIIRLRIKGHESEIANNYYKLIKILFRQPRKTILNNLSALKNKGELRSILEKTGIDPAARPQNLSLESIKKLLFVLTSIL